MKFSKEFIIWVVWLSITLIYALFSVYNNPTQAVEFIEWDNHPLQTKEFIEEQIAIEWEVVDKAMKRASILREIRDEMLDSHWLQVKTVVLEDVVEVEQVETLQRFIPWWKTIPSWITWNTKEKRFQNFVRYFARGFDESVFVQARQRYWVKEEVLACIARADSDMWNANKSANNIMNIGNNDRWETRSFDSVLWSVMSAAYSMSKWRYLSRNTKIWELSQWWRTQLGLSPCVDSWVYCYATSHVNWRRNVNNCLTFIEWERLDRDRLPFNK